MLEHGPVAAALGAADDFCFLGDDVAATAALEAEERFGGGLWRLFGGALAGVGSFISVLYNPTVNFQMGYHNGLYAFTAAVLGGIGNIPGAVLGGFVIGLVRSLGTGYVGERES